MGVGMGTHAQGFAAMLQSTAPDMGIIWGEHMGTQGAMVRAASSRACMS